MRKKNNSIRKKFSIFKSNIYFVTLWPSCLSPLAASAEAGEATLFSPEIQCTLLLVIVSWSFWRPSRWRADSPYAHETEPYIHEVCENSLYSDIRLWAEFTHIHLLSDQQAGLNAEDNDTDNLYFFFLELCKWSVWVVLVICWL